MLPGYRGKFGGTGERVGRVLRGVQVLFEQLYEPVGNLAVSTLIAAIPIIVLFVLLAGVRMAAQWASLITLAVALVIAVLAYQMPLGLAIYSGMTFTLGLAFASTGFLYVFFASFIGWLGVALTGSDTSSNALFANLQKVTAQQIEVSPNLTVGANSSGGVLGKMSSPQNLAVGTSATGLQGREGDLLRLVLKWSIGLTIVMSILVVLQATVLNFMVP
jgi:L-lactate permease